MATEGNNYKKAYAETRDAFFCDGEKEFFEELMQDPYEKKTNNILKHSTADKRHQEALKLIERVESGEFNEEQMETVEYCLAQLLGSLEDAHIVKVKEKDFER